MRLLQILIRGRFFFPAPFFETITDKVYVSAYQSNRLFMRNTIMASKMVCSESQNDQSEKKLFLRWDFWSSQPKIVNFETINGIGSTLSYVNYMVAHIGHYYCGLHAKYRRVWPLKYQYCQKIVPCLRQTRLTRHASMSFG